MNPIAIYQSASGAVEVRLDNDTVWLSQEQMTQLFGRERSVITKHVRNVFAEGELVADSVCANFAHTAQDGKTYQVLHYNLYVIISVGYRVKSPQGVQFRQWATRLLREHLTLGYTVNRQRFEANAAQTPELNADTGRGLVSLANPPTPAWKPRPRTCCASSSKTTRLPTATNAVARSCLWTFCTATGGC